MSNNIFSPLAHLTHFVTGLCLLTLACGNTAIAEEPYRNYELAVVPATWVPSGADNEAEPHVRPEAALIFPSLLDPDSAPGDVVFTAPSFFRPNNRFPAAATFYWPRKEDALISITVQRAPPTSQTAEFIIRKADETVLRKLQWKSFEEVQSGFRRWILRSSGCWLFGNPSERFNALDTTLSSLWKGNILAQATFKEFAGRYLNVPMEFTVNYSGSDTDIRNQMSTDPHFTEMTAIPVGQTEQLRILWGTTAIYPHGTFGVLGGVSRAAVSAQSDIQIVSQTPGLGLYPPDTAKTLSIFSVGTTGLDDNKVFAPFPSAMGSLFGRLFVPIFTPFDLHDRCLLTPYPCGTSSPKYLFLLTPSEIVKPEADNGVQSTVVQFASDARTDAALTDFAGQLTRRTILIGLDQLDEADPSVAVSKELSRIVDTAINKTMMPNDHGYTAAIFANETAVEVRRHISIDGRTLEITQPRLARWADVVGVYMPHSLLQPTDHSSPRLIIKTIKRPTSSYPTRRLTIRLFSVEDDVLKSARISEGDEYHAGPNL